MRRRRLGAQGEVGLRALFGLVLVGGCAVHAQRVEQLVRIGWYGEACQAASVLGDPRVDADVVRAHAATAPRFTLRALPASTWGGDDPAYGRDWVVLEAAWDVAATPAPVIDGWVEIGEPTDGGLRQWSVCRPETCDAAWVARRLGVGDRGDLRGALGAIARVAALPFAMMVDLMVGVTRQELPRASADRGRPLSFRLLDQLGAPADTNLPAGFPAVWSAPPCEGAGRCVRRWVATPGRPQEGATEGVRVQVTWEHEGCDVQAAWIAPLGAGATLPERVDAVGTVDLRAIPAAAGVVHGM